MRPLERVERTRRALATTIATRAVLWAIAATLAVAATTTIVLRRSGRPDGVAPWFVAGFVGVIVLVVLLAPWRRLTVSRVALWIEERVPRLEYALVTAVDPATASAPVAPLLDRQIAAISWASETRRAIGRALIWPAVAAVAAVGTLLLAQRVAFARVASAPDATLSATSTASRNAASPFARLVATVRTPAYAGGRVLRVESPGSIVALVGSSITFEAPGAGDGITADTGTQALVVQRDADRWRVALTVGARPTLVRFRHASGERIVALEPRADSTPTVRLLVPLRDTVMRVARGAMPLSAEAHDDIGLASGAFEYIVSSGEGESFQFRSGTLGARQYGGALNGGLSASLPLDGLNLKPGDMVHLRAVARDGNTVSGPGIGASETRVLRIARAGEYDSIAVEGAPPPDADKSLISERMLIILTEALDRRRPTLARETLISESHAIGRDQTRLRKRVGDIIFARLGDNPSGEEGRDPDEQPASADTALRADSASRDAALLRAASAATGKGDEILDFEGDETPVVAINRPLLEAYNAMWEASRELDQGETARALPPMRRALAAIQRARQAERIYLRGKAPTVVVDLARVRLTGKETGAASARVPRQAVDPGAARRAERLAAAIELASRAPAAAIDSLVLLRVESLDAAPRLAAAIADALDAMRNGRDASMLLSRARRVADGTVRGAGRLGAWSGVW